MSSWTKFVTAFYKKKHASNPSYKFKHALKEAGKSYKSSGTETMAPKMGKSMKRGRRGSRKFRGTRKNR